MAHQQKAKKSIVGITRDFGSFTLLILLLGPCQRMLAELCCFRLVRLSVRGHSNSVIFHQISSNIYGLLPSTSRSSSNTGFVRHPINQDGRHLSISAVVVTLTQSFLIRFLQNFIYESLPSTFCSSSNMGFVRHLIRWPTKWLPPINVCCCGHSNLVILYRISFKFHIWIAFIKHSFKIEYGFCLIKR